MSTNSAIEWTTHTFNAWRGCTKVSAGCAHCYAETLSKRNPKTLGIWGDHGTRVPASELYWRLPFAWDKAAKTAGERHRVFCASLADVFEDRPELVAWRRRLLDVVCRTPNLDWLLLTKRPQNALRMMVEAGLYAVENPSLPRPQPNLWIGTSVEDQKAADERIPHLLRCPAAVRFLSMEPLIGPVDLLSVGGATVLGCPDPAHRIDVLRLGCWSKALGYSSHSDLSADCGGHGIDWVIVGGESGAGARPMHPNWVRLLRDQCEAAGVAFFFKQWGEWAPFNDNREPPDAPETAAVCLVKHDGQVIRPYAQVDAPGHQMCRVGKKAAGRMLDGRTWDEMPKAAVVPAGSEAR